VKQVSDTIIQVENLSKKYILGYERESYTSLRDAIANGTKALLNPFQKQKSQIKSSQGDFWALNDVSFDIKQGDRVGIVGRNGAGKSTLLKILSRITEPTKGSVKIQGRVASLLEVGTGFHPELTGRENIYLNGAILGMSKVEIQRKFDEIVAFAEVERFLNTPVKRYSSGMYVRLAFAVAAHLEPEILIVDEVLAVGDAQFQKKCLGKMEDISKTDSRTILFVSHNMDAIKSLCTTGVLLEKGKLKQQSDIHSLVSSYNNLNLDSSINSVTNLSLSDNLFLETFNCNFCHNKLEFTLQIRAEQESCQILSVAVLLYTLSGTRLALIDLGDKEASKVPLDAKKSICYKASVNDLSLVSGHYKLGFAIQTSHGWVDKYQILDLLVDEDFSLYKENPGVLKYPSEIRGVINLNYTFGYSIQ
jgi:lipopolysaccharide transport system ATP-binding protein